MKKWVGELEISSSRIGNSHTSGGSSSEIERDRESSRELEKGRKRSREVERNRERSRYVQKKSHSLSFAFTQSRAFCDYMIELTRRAHTSGTKIFGTIFKFCFGRRNIEPSLSLVLRCCVGHCIIATCCFLSLAVQASALIAKQTPTN